MAKGITIFGTLNGTLGETVYYRSGGEQKQRIRIRKPKNPQTNKQLYQRARFAAAGMFYTHGRQSFFPYAFEDKRPNESNFNAFMRNNIALAYPVSKSVVDSVAYPIINDWIVSKGSLPKLQVERFSWDNGETDGVTFTFPKYTSMSAITTMQELSRALIETGDYENGDIITFLTILTDVRLSSTGYGIYPEISPTISEAAHWFIKQFNVNVADTTPLSTYGLAARIEDNNTIRLGIVGANSSWWTNQLAAGTVIHSRVRGSRTMVSTQQLVLSATADTQLKTFLIGNYQQYVEEVIANWRTGDVSTVIRPEETLQGANSINLDFTPEPARTLNVKVTQGSINGQKVSIRPGMIGTPGQTNQIVMSFDFGEEAEDLRTTIVKFTSSYNNQQYTLNYQDSQNITVATTESGSPYNASVNVGIGDIMIVSTNNTTEPLLTPWPITIDSITIDGVTYNNFAYEDETTGE